MSLTAKRVVVITGASSGVGRATAIAFAKQGARLALIARNQLALESTAREVRENGGEALILPLDVSDARAVNEAADRIEGEWGPIRIWVNDAMVSVMGPISELAPEEFERVTQVSYLGYVWGTQAALRVMRKRDQGVIIQVGSALAHRSIPLQSAYCGAKHAIVGFTESVRCELIHEGSGIRISIVELPGVNTPQFNWVRNKMPYKSKPVGAIYEPEVAAQAIVWLSEHPRKEILLGLPTYESVFGNRFFPAALDRYLARKVYREHFTHERESARADNLFEPVAVDYGIRGPYSTQALEHSPLLTMSQMRRWIALGITSVAALLVSRRALGQKVTSS